MKIYKEDVLEALEDEPLTSGEWLSSDGCKACPVGATLKTVGVSVPPLESREAYDMLGNPYTIRYHNDASFTSFTYIATKVTAAESVDVNYYEKQRMRNATWLSYLSIYWETLKMPIEEARIHTYDWVKANFPEDTDLTERVM